MKSKPYQNTLLFLERQQKFNQLIKDEQKRSPEEYARELGLAIRTFQRLVERCNRRECTIKYSRAEQRYIRTTEAEK